MSLRANALLETSFFYQSYAPALIKKHMFEKNSLFFLAEKNKLVSQFLFNSLRIVKSKNLRSPNPKTKKRLWSQFNLITKFWNEHVFIKTFHKKKMNLNRTQNHTFTKVENIISIFCVIKMVNSELKYELQSGGYNAERNWKQLFNYAVIKI